MFTEKAKEFIRLELTNRDGRVDETLTISDVDVKIHAFELALEVSSHLTRLSGLKNSIVNQINIMAEEGRIGSMEELEKTAQYLEIFIYLNNKKAYEKIDGNKSEDGKVNNSAAIPDYLAQLGILDERRKGFLKTVYKEAEYYHNGQLSTMEKVYGNLYYIRNDEAHNVRTLSITQQWQYVKELLVVYLEVAGTFQARLEEETNRINLAKETNAKEYIEKYITEYEKNKTFNYIELEGKQDNGSNKKEQLTTIISSDDSCKIKLMGNAGMGKTTTIKYLAYKDAKDITSSRTPIFIELKNISKEKNSVIGIISDNDHLACSEEITRKLLKNGYLNLYIDGINEIKDESQKTEIVSELNSIIITYSKTKVVITDRITNTNTVSSNVGIYVIEKLTDNQIEEFVNTNTGDPDLSKEIMDELTESPALKEMIRIPFKLYKLITMKQDCKSIPTNLEEFDQCFTDFLIKREVEEKQVKSARDIESFLTKLIEKGSKEMKRSDIIEIFGEVITAKHLSNDTSDGVLDLMVDMDILRETSFNKYSLTNTELIRTMEDKQEISSFNFKGLI